MDLHPKQQNTHISPLHSTKFKPKTNLSINSGGSAANKFVGVRRRPSGRWVAEIKDTTQKIRMWLGTFETAEAAALAYDEAARLLRGSNTRTNFTNRRPSAAGDSPVATRIRKLLHHKKLTEDGDCNLSPQHHKNATFFSSAAAPTPAGGGGVGGCGIVGSTTVKELEQEIGLPWFAGEEFEVMFNGFGLSESGGGLPEMCGRGAAEEVGVFERMRVERQISASLYAMNGVQEYFEAMEEFSVSSSLLDTVWDFPPFL